MFNKIILVGNLTREIEIRYSKTGMGIAKTAIATSRKFTSNGEKKEEVCFVDITFFGRSAEVANQYLRKGSKILVEGRLNFEQWVDQNGQKRSKHSVIVETMQMLDSKGDNQQGGGYNAPAQNGGYNATQQGQAQGYQQPMQQQQHNYNNNQGNLGANAPIVHENIPASKTSMSSTSSTIPEISISENEVPF